MDGSIVLAGAGARTVETVTGDIKVKVPLVGGKIEALVGDLLGHALDVEQRVGRTWLAEER
jgi:hypothetical protein